MRFYFYIFKIIKYLKFRIAKTTLNMTIKITLPRHLFELEDYKLRDKEIKKIIKQKKFNLSFPSSNDNKKIDNFDEYINNLISDASKMEIK